MPKVSFKPPQIAGWLIYGMADAEQAETILGDLLEEFSDLASKSGFKSARRWYWRQTLSTIAHLFVTGFRSGIPWAIAGVIVGFFLLQAFLVGFIDRILLTQTSARFLWTRDAVFLWCFLVSFFIGCIVAAEAKGREIGATLTLSLIFDMCGAVLLLVWWGTDKHTFLVLPIITTFVGSILIFLSGAVVRQSRSTSTRRITP
jgi:hypothetical protein